MTHFYLGNWASQGDYECHRDDGGYDSNEEMANPVGAILTGRTPGHIKALLDTAWEDAAELHFEDIDGDWPEQDWQTDGGTWDEAKGKGYQQWYSPELDMVVILCLRQPLEPAGGPE